MKAIYTLIQMNDDRLMYLLAKGHMDALEELYHRHWKGIYLEIFKRVKEHGPTERVLEKCLLYVWYNRHMVGKSDTFPTHMSTVTKLILLSEVAKNDTISLETFTSAAFKNTKITYTILEDYN
jgi:hypothetical protein